MGERTQRVIKGIQRLFEDLSTHVKEERVIRYIVEELRQGRGFDDVLLDPYIVNNTTTSDRERLLENPAMLRGIEQEIAAEFDDYRQVGAE